MKQKSRRIFFFFFNFSHEVFFSGVVHWAWQMAVGVREGGGAEAIKHEMKLKLHIFHR